MARSLSRSRHWYEVAAAVPVLAVFAPLYAWAAPFEDPTQPFDAYLWLALAFALPTLLWLATTWLLVHHWWEGGAGERWSAMDAPGWLLATVVVTLPESRRAWGEAMLGELAHVQGRKARWRFALSSARALPFLSIARGRRCVRGGPPAPIATVLVTSAVAGSIAITVAFVRRHPDAAEGLPPGRLVFLAVVLAGCLRLALASPRRTADSGISSGRLAPYLGVGAALIFALGVLVSVQSIHDELVPVWLFFGPMLTFGAPACLAAAKDRSFRAGVRAGTWTAITVMPLTFALLLVEASRQHASDGQWFFAGDVTTAGFTVRFALFILVAVPVIGFPFAVIGAAAGAHGRGTAP